MKKKKKFEEPQISKQSEEKRNEELLATDSVQQSEATSKGNLPSIEPRSLLIEDTSNQIHTGENTGVTNPYLFYPRKQDSRGGVLLQDLELANQNKDYNKEHLTTEKKQNHDKKKEESNHRDKKKRKEEEEEFHRDKRRRENHSHHQSRNSISRNKY